MRHWVTLLMVSIVCATALRSMLEPGYGERRTNHWQELQRQAAELALRKSKNCSAVSAEEEVQLLKQQALQDQKEVEKQQDKLYQASLILARRWKETSRHMGAGFDKQFMSTADELAGVYLLEGNLKEAVKCYQSLLEYDSARLGEDHLLVARDCNNLGLACYLVGTTRKSPAERKASLSMAGQMLSRSRKILLRLAAGSVKDRDQVIVSSREIVASNRSFVRRELAYD